MDKKEYRDRLLATSEEDAAKLPREEWYDRIRYIREIMGMEMLKSYQGTAILPVEKKMAPRSLYRPPRVYKNFPGED